MYLFIDTETNGLPDYNNGNYSNVRLVQIAWKLYGNSRNNILEKRDFIVRPQGFVISKESSSIHKISNDLALSAGKEIDKVLKELSAAVKRSKYVIGHNIEFDLGVINNEFSLIRTISGFSDKHIICTMRDSTAFVGIHNSKGLKWPNLAELYLKIFNKVFDESHNASKDIEATAKCFWWLIDNKIIALDKINKDLDLEFVQNNSITISKNRSKSIINKENMEKKLLAIKLKSYCESLKDGDSVSKRQIEKLFEMVDDLVEILNSEEDEDDDFSSFNSSSNTNRTPLPPFIDDEDGLPF